MPGGRRIDCLTLAVVLALLAPGAVGQGAGPRVELRVGQGGVVGTTGTVYEIGPAGDWTVSRFLNDRVDPPHATGTLGADEMAALADLLPDAPEGALTKGPIVNAFRLELRVDGRVWTVETVRGAEPAPCTGGGEPACAVTDVAGWIAGHLMR